MKLQHRRPSGELHPTETPEERWEVISVNFIVKLPDSHGYDVIMNIDNPNTTETLEYTKDKYNTKIIK
jgi:hypothetical protein